MSMTVKMPRLIDNERERWGDITDALLAGAELRRGPNLPYFYTWTPLTGHSMGGLNATSIRKLETAGMIKRVGVDAYALTQEAIDLLTAPPPLSLPAAVIAIQQYDLFGAAA